MSAEDRLRALLCDARVIDKGAPDSSPALPGEPADLTALWSLAGGLSLADGTRLLSRGEVLSATAWLVAEKSLEWGPELWVIGERDDLVIVRDLDPSSARAGGGVLEAATDGLSVFARAAMDGVGYLESRLGLGSGGAPEALARAAAAGGDAEALSLALERGFYPGAERDRWQAGLSLGGLLARSGDEAGALSAFEDAVSARVRGAPRGSEERERAAGWKGCAIAAEKAGAKGLAEVCRGLSVR